MSEAKHSPAPWEYENVEVRSEQSAYGVVKDANGKILFDTLNSDVAEIHTEYDEGHAYRWDEQGRKNLKMAAAAPAMLAALEAAEPILRAYIPADQFDGHAAEALRLVSAALAAAR